MHKISAADLKKIVKKFRGKRILVVGDLMLDKYIWGNVTRISPEAPIPIVHVTKEETKPGGAANVVLNLIALGAKVFCAGIVGKDDAGRELVSYLKKNGVDCSAIIMDSERPTTIKTRVIAHQQQVVRIDKENGQPIRQEMLDKIVKKIKRMKDKIDAAVLSDYNKGIFTANTVQEIITTLRGKIITADPKPKNLKFFRNVTLISPNKKEASEATGITMENERDILHAARDLKNTINAEAILITRGEEGMSLYDGSNLDTIPTRAREVYDVTGAGDTVISTVTAALSAGASFKEASLIANIAAGIVVAEVGVATVTPEELLSVINNGL
ncbi:MAG: D-glycero-beta-D-manno-heptose-7-phosphate kinase [Candidatus Goldbacteria bacterium]|nr:D-glycero-beta-D-manno-heptose-7-phosphate kinase [Candidatus Goldiibacteriota bacterium]HPD18585.1 D-glycero-beta-D-manno-heptose-7-phosphate kinase [Candidatus Goldiibacteriota bacterium]